MSSLPPGVGSGPEPGKPTMCLLEHGRRGAAGCPVCQALAAEPSSGKVLATAEYPPGSRTPRTPRRGIEELDGRPDTIRSRVGGRTASELRRLADEHPIPRGESETISYRRADRRDPRLGIPTRTEGPGWRYDADGALKPPRLHRLRRWLYPTAAWERYLERLATRGRISNGARL